ncbi:MAG: hypothetical protein F6K40_33405 [Okeania sp. SIO3I5]|uniref:hypothetical protein n=1 Tax=Okeania sp. SIO3I5 TaxID=2607805 RepID=UPI0013BC646B|nr:hypothetical protein [Okeania sp. SIO3I5]NEQ40855.1 hypothetical protein [Okeania sp. SIO3I5]
MSVYYKRSLSSVLILWYGTGNVSQKLGLKSAPLTGLKAIVSAARIQSTKRE